MVRRRPRRWVLSAGAVVVAGLGVLAAGTWYDLNRARAQLHDARTELAALVDHPTLLRTPAGRAEARRTAAAARDGVEAAGRRLRRSVPLKLVGVLPGFSHQRGGALHLVADAGAGSVIGSRLLASLDRLTERGQVRGATVPLAELDDLRQDIERAAADLDATRRGGSGLWGPLASARHDYNRSAGSTARRLRDAAEGIAAASSFLGGDTPRRYLLAIQNNAEMRAQGMVLSFAFVRAAGGRLTVEGAGPITDLNLDSPIALPVPPGMDRMFRGLAPNRVWQSVNASADFAWSGRAMAEMAHQATGQAVDGVIGMDITALVAMLRVVGPVSVDGIAEPLGAANAADLLLNRLYATFPRNRDQGDRKERLGAVVQSLLARLVGGSFDVVRLGSELAVAAGGGHLHLWSADPAEEAAFERSGLGGGPGLRSPDRTFHVSVQNATASKLDYFVKPRVEMRISLTPSGAAVVNTDVVVANTAPPDAPESYQFGPDGVGQTRPGQYIARVYLWGPRGADQEGSVVESGLQLSQGPTTVDPGQERTVRFLTVIPDAVRDGRLDLRLVPQPRLDPARLHVTLSAPGWEVGGRAKIDVVWDRTVAASWTLRR